MLADLLDATHLHAWAYLQVNKAEKARDIERPAAARRPELPAAEDRPEVSAAPTVEAPHKYSSGDEIRSFFGAGPGLAVLN
jgi:hypothetical protein